jgi:hypothetical protein
MKRSNTRSIGDLLGDFVAENNLGDKLKETEAVEYWIELVETGIGHYTRKTWLSKGVLYAEISSSVVRSELMMVREELRQRINRKAGSEIVRRIVLR